MPKFTELAPEARLAALHSYRFINFSENWCDDLCNGFMTELQKYGIKCEGFYWRLVIPQGLPAGRNDRKIFHMIHPEIADMPSFLNSMGVDTKNEGVRKALSWKPPSIIPSWMPPDNPETDYVIPVGLGGVECSQKLHQMELDFIKLLQARYDNLKDPVKVVEALVAKGWDFTLTGYRLLELPAQGDKAL